MKRFAPIAALALLAGCEPEAPRQAVAAPLPEQVCSDARESNAQATKTGALILNNPLEAVLAHESWLAMPEAHRDGLTRAMGIAATCAAGSPQLQQEVVVRSETGIVLTRRIVQTSSSLPTLQ